jgi:hypothetical protein
MVTVKPLEISLQYSLEIQLFSFYIKVSLWTLNFFLDNKQSSFCMLDHLMRQYVILSKYMKQVLQYFLAGKEVRAT